MPLSLYVAGAAAAIVATFLVVAMVLRRARRSDAYWRIDLLTSALGRPLAHPAFAFAIRFVAVGLFILTAIAGFTGNPDPYRNIAPTLVWVIGWVGLAYASALVGDVWTLINPWRTTFDWVDSASRHFSGSGLSLGLRYPKALGLWPAVILLFSLTWTELVYPSPAIPSRVAFLLIAYSILTWIGMFLFGRNTWLRNGEVFTVLFGTFARFAPIDAPLTLRPFGAGLRDNRHVSTSMMAFVLLMLSSVLYDGALTTPEWTAFESGLTARLQALGDLAPIVVRTGGLVGFWLAFLGAFVAVNGIMSGFAAGRRSPLELARAFAFSLVPIAIGYHVAHYLVFLLVQGQYIVPLASDPFGYGWNLFGTAQFRPDIAIVGARFAWYTAIAAIVLGHIAAVYLAHLKAMEIFNARGAALRSQIPLTALMVAYTFISLSLLAEPLVERRAPAEPSAIAAAAIEVPQSAVLPDPQSGHLRPVGGGKTAKAKLTYRVLGSAFHDGTRTTAADLVYAYAFAYRWSTRRDANDAHYDSSIDAATAAMRRQLVAVQVTGTDVRSKSFRVGDANFVRELFIVDVYVSGLPGDPERDAAMAPPWSTLPWHVVALMEEAVSRNWAAFSSREAARRGVEWLDMVRSEDLKPRLARLIETFAHEGYRPAPLQALVTADEARKRWAALAAFYQEHKHFLVTNGPYRLQQWSTNAVTLSAFRDLSYPLGVGSYDAYAIPRRGFITQVEWNGRQVTLSAEIETIYKFQRSYRLERTPIRAVPAPLLKRAAPECRYVVYDTAGRVVRAGAQPLGEDFLFRIDLDRALPTGRYELLAMVTVDGNVMNADIRRIPVVLSSP